MNALIRPRQGRVLAGVCAAVANRFGWNTAVVRVLTVIGVVFFGVSILVYILLWILIPQEPPA
ncbi:PspC domain-containing protein [Microbacterium rhizomatis]|uniref:PspC domain-containing protein n=1 Tax=Microbacterium rhizomatis TaxID=1631477 RepID=A0A5J5J9Q1_9MICO|nr:PspC domain-containing protein [Microbacterium rhizomatis]KAA9111528.1 PspC domain-containing protein [Microbacterium rhizomatis]